MGLMPGTSPLADVDQPIDMLMDCHRRVEWFLLMLNRVANEAPEPLDDEFHKALTVALDYFDGAAPLHTADEEDGLFPLLQLHADQPAVAEVLTVIEQLESEHETAQPWHDDIDRIGRQWLESRSVSAGDRAVFTERAADLVRLYSGHIRTEDTVVFPVARAVLSPKELQELGAAMRERRGGFCRERKATQN